MFFLKRTNTEPNWTDLDEFKLNREILQKNNILWDIPTNQTNRIIRMVDLGHKKLTGKYNMCKKLLRFNK